MLIESFHSGHRGHRIYCSLHRPTTRLVRGTGVVLCNPLGHEYYRAHRSYMKLAVQLSQLGFPVMRFDYAGCGDSEGERVHERLDAWLDEIAHVVELLRRSEPVTNVALGGLRFGAALSLLASQRIESVSALLLWDASLDGEKYVAEIERLHVRMLGDMERFPRARRRSECNEGELIGTEFPPILLREIAAVSPAKLLSGTSGITDVIVAGGNDDTDKMLHGVCQVRVNQHRTSRDYGWDDVHRIGETIMDPAAIRHFTSSMSTVAA